jgi:hypothetical protein
MLEHIWKKTAHVEPHEYIMVADDPQLAADINASEIKEEFRGVKWRYLYRDSYKHWIAYPCINRVKAQTK